MNRRLLLIFVFLISLLPALYLTYLHTVDPFLYTPLSDISDAFSSGRLNAISTDQPTYILTLYTISSICNIAPLQLAYLPIGALIFPFCIYALARRIVGSRTIPILLILYFAFDISIYTGHFSVLAYAWAHPLFFIFILLYMMYSTSDKRNPSLIALILIIFTSIVFLHPTYVFWAVSFAIALNLLIAISKAVRLSNVKLIPTPFLTISLFAIYFGFNQIYFGFYIHRAILIEPEIITEQFSNMVRSFLGFSAPLSTPYQMFVGAPTAVIGYATFARTLILVSCILLGIVAWLKMHYRDFSKKFDNMLVIATALLIAGMMHTIGYAAYGHISMRFMILVFPIIAILLLKKVELKKTMNVMVALIIVLAFSQTISYIAGGSEVNDIDVETVASSDWLTSHTHGKVVFLSDFITSQMTKFYFKNVGREVTQQFYSSELFSLIVTGDNKIASTEFVIVNMQMNWTSSTGWATFEPLKHYEVEIGENVNLNKIYDDGIVTIFRSTSFQ